MCLVLFVARRCLPRSELKGHMRDTHETASCSHCCGRFTTKEDVDEHIRTEHLVAPCDECERNFLMKELLEEDQQENHLSISCNEEDCPKCEKKCSDKHAMRNYMIETTVRKKLWVQHLWREAEEEK